MRRVYPSTAKVYSTLRSVRSVAKVLLRILIHAGITDVVPHTYPPHRWLEEYMEDAYGFTEKLDTFCAQLDTFAKLQGWERSQDEKKNRILNPSKDDFLQGVSALLQLQYHNFPVAMVCSLSCATNVNSHLSFTAYVAPSRERMIWA
jgi:hypothetical protein